MNSRNNRHRQSTVTHNSRNRTQHSPGKDNRRCRRRQCNRRHCRRIQRMGMRQTMLSITTTLCPRFDALLSPHENTCTFVAVECNALHQRWQHDTGVKRSVAYATAASSSATTAKCHESGVLKSFFFFNKQYIGHCRLVDVSGTKVTDGNRLQLAAGGAYWPCRSAPTATTSEKQCNRIVLTITLQQQAATLIGYQLTQHAPTTAAHNLMGAPTQVVQQQPMNFSSSPFIFNSFM